MVLRTAKQGTTENLNRILIGSWTARKNIGGVGEIAIGVCARRFREASKGVSLKGVFGLAQVGPGRESKIHNIIKL